MSIGLVGIGYWGSKIARDVYKLNHLRAICDKNITTFPKIMETYPNIAYSTTNLNDLLKDADITAIMIATPSHSHYSIAKQVLDAGKDCYIEKPMTTGSIKEANELVKIAKKKDLILMIGHVLQYHRGINKIYSMIEDDKIGDILYITSNRLNLGRIRKEENVMLSFAPHDISLILKLMGDEMPTKIISHGYSTIAEYDVTTTILRFSNNRYAQINVNWLNPFKEHKLTIVGTKGMITFEKDTITFYPEYLKDNQVIVPRSRLILYDNDRPPLELECEHFIQCCQSRAKPITDGEEGLRVMKILNTALSSLRKDSIIHETAIIDLGATIGNNTKIWHFTHLMSSARIGDNCKIGQNCFIAGKIGDGCKVQNNVSIYEGVIAGDRVFFGPSCVLTNDLTPRAAISKNGKYLSTIIEDDVTIGANATILCGIKLGQGCMIGAGAVVVKDVPTGKTVVGNPARIIK